MVRTLRSWTLRGLRVVDVDGCTVGTVSDTWPLDGGGEPDLVLVQVGHRFARPRWLPLRGARVLGDRVHVPYGRLAIDDAPSAEDHRWGHPADVARAYWLAATD